MKNTVINKLEIMVKELNARDNGYSYELSVCDWENYGKSRTYFKVVETRQHSTHRSEFDYGYFDNKSEAYIGGKCDANGKYDMFGNRIEETTEESDTKGMMEMKKQFKTIEEFREYINGITEKQTMKNMLLHSVTDDEVIESLTADGYNLNDLTADGHAYEIGKYKNNGWIYEDEVDAEHIKLTGSDVELKKRKK